MNNLIHLITIIPINNEKGSFQRLDTKKIINPDDFEILREPPVLYMIPVGSIPQLGVYSNYFGEDFNEKPARVNAILLSKRKITHEKIEIYAGQYCHIKE